MKVSLWAEIRRLSEIEKLSRRAIAKRLRCCHTTVNKALALERPPHPAKRSRRGSRLDPFKPRIDALLVKHPQLSAVRVLEEIRRGDHGYTGRITLVRDYLRQVRPRRSRVYQEVRYEPAQAMQVDWGSCGQIQIGGTRRNVSVFVAVLCHSRLMHIEFCLAQRKAEFYRAIVRALEFFGGSPRQIIFDNLKAAVVSGHGRQASLHPEFLALCGHFCLEPIACQRRDPESKGIVEASVRYVKQNALAGRGDSLTRWEDYSSWGTTWRDEVANVRLHHITRQRPIDRFQSERGLLRPLPALAFDTDELAPAVVSSHARVTFDGNRYSVPPTLARQTAHIRANETQVRVIFQGAEVACHARSYDRQQLVCHPDHQLAALRLRHRAPVSDVEAEFDALGDEARRFHLALRQRPVKTTAHLRRVLRLARLYGRTEVIAALVRALEYQTFDAAYVETLLLQERRRRELPSPTLILPRRREWIDETDLEEPNPATYDRLCDLAHDDLRRDDSAHDTPPARDPHE